MTFYQIMVVIGPGNGSPSATNVVVVVVLVLGVVVIRISIPQGSVGSQPIVMQLFTHIEDCILHQATVAELLFTP